MLSCKKFLNLLLNFAYFSLFSIGLLNNKGTGEVLNITLNGWLSHIHSNSDYYNHAIIIYYHASAAICLDVPSLSSTVFSSVSQRQFPLIKSLSTKLTR